MTFEEWYRSLPVLEQPQFTNIYGWGGPKTNIRVVYSTDPELWRLSDCKVTTANACLVYLKKTDGNW